MPAFPFRSTRGAARRPLVMPRWTRMAGDRFRRSSRVTFVPPQLGDEAPPLLVARNLEPVARSAVLAAGTPGRNAALAVAIACTRSRACFVLRAPQLSAREPHQRRVGVS